MSRATNATVPSSSRLRMLQLGIAHARGTRLLAAGDADWDALNAITTPG
jgi:hypothetical protein